MVNKKYLAIGLILVVAVAVFLIFFVDWEARAVKKQLRSIAKEMAWGSAENELTIAVRIRHVQEKVAETCQIEVPSYKISLSVAKKDVPAYMMMARNYYKNLSVKFEDLKVESIQLPQARAIATAYVKAATADGQRNDEAMELKFYLQKVEKTWQITDVNEVQVLSR
ncbi:MAG: hypothetical protein JW976_06440 [Syntrophaceae bacterium]|nr:hypothetical protein [Syntrophaceae bacterium]